jgi:kinesin family member 18/19
MTRDQLLSVRYHCYVTSCAGAGKTHTMQGSSRKEEADSGAVNEVSGIMPQSLVDIFAGVAARRAAAAAAGARTELWTVRVGYLEVYNEQILDLLEPGKQLKVCEDTTKGVVKVAGLAEKDVHSCEEVLALLRVGNANRKTEATMANQVSSRSHAVLQVTVTRRHTDGHGSHVNRYVTALHYIA